MLLTRVLRESSSAVQVRGGECAPGHVGGEGAHGVVVVEAAAAAAAA